MEEWGQLVNQLILAQGLTCGDVESAVRDCMDFRLRTGVQELFQIAHNNNIPLIVILSNSMVWSREGLHTGFSDPHLHMFNKDLRCAPQKLKEMIEGRHVGILCGDSLGDLTMTIGHTTSTLLKVGFLNDKVDERVEQYCRETAYDRVVLGDGTFEPLLEVLRQ